MTVNQRFNVSPWYEVPKHEALDNIKSNVKKTVAPLHQKLHNIVSFSHDHTQKLHSTKRK